MTKKKDPLKDNRIFPEEMHEKPKRKNKKSKHDNFSWFWFVTGSALLIFLVWFGFVYQNNGQIPGVDQGDKEHQEQLAAFNTMQQSHDVITAERREDKIKQLFGTK